MDLFWKLSYYLKTISGGILGIISALSVIIALLNGWMDIQETKENKEAQSSAPPDIKTRRHSSSTTKAKKPPYILLGVVFLLAVFSVSGSIAVKVPDVTGIYFEDARTRLSDQELKYSGTLSDKSYVRSQSPIGGEIVQRGATIYLEGEPEPTVDPTSPSSPEVPPIGSIITFGNYEQEGKTGNRSYPIYWRVLEVESDKALLISDKALESKRYHDFDESVTWETCTLRYWLNNDFYNAAFSETDKQSIVLSEVDGNVKDHIFLLSFDELNQFFHGNEERKCAATDHAVQDQGAYVNPETGTCWWWLRSQKSGSRTAVSVNSTGEIDMDSRVAGMNGTVRPVMWISLTQNK